PKPFIIPVFLPHCGCPHRCVFCNQTAITGSAADFPDKKKLQETIRKFLSHKGKKRGKTEISFYGGNFLGLTREKIRACLEAAQYFTGQNAVDGLRFSTRPDTISRGRLQWIADYPVSTIEIRVQSMVDAVLDASRRGHSADDARQALARLKQAGYQTGIQLMVGLPGDSPERSAYTAREVVSLAPDFVRIYPALVIENSPLARWYRAGRYRPLSLNECVSRVKDLYRIFSAADIPVIRMGLQATDGLSSGGVLAGPYHPALGHMVRAEIMRDQAAEKIRQLAPARAAALTLRVNLGNYSQMQGLKRQNLTELKTAFALSRIDLIADPELPESFVSVSTAP
ncbi:MAG: elongator complex protein 3, partial [Thermodesulfobacteriota bacterium]